MRAFKLTLMMCCLLISFSVTCGSKEDSKGFFMITIPKSGTHLLTKLLQMLTERDKCAVSYLNNSLGNLTDEQFELENFKAKQNNQFLYGHTNPHAFGPFFMRFGQNNPEWISILQVRDLRDVIVSYVYFMENEIHQEMGGYASFERMLTHILQSRTSGLSSSLELFIQYAIEWTKQPNVMISRFEDLVGPSGGGSKQAQEEAILSMASTLGVSLSSKELHTIARTLFGNKQGPRSGTFRSGQVGSWRQHFKSRHIQMFNERWGTYQIALGYPI